jgi:hypothetical protein
MRFITAAQTQTLFSKTIDFSREESPVDGSDIGYIPILIAEFSSDRKLMGDLDVPGGHALRAPVETGRWFGH